VAGLGDELNARSGEPAQGVLVAFEHHDVGMVTAATRWH